MLKKYLTVFFVSMIPLIELRGAIPYGVIFGLPLWSTYIIAIIGNMIPVPFIYLFARKFLIWGYHKPLIGPICKFCIVKGEKGGRAPPAAAFLLLCCCLWAFPCPAPAHGPAPWPPAYWIWISRKAFWPAWAAFCWQAALWAY